MLGEGEVVEPGPASWNDVLSEEHEDVDLAWKEGDEHETSVICFSSGTEGLSKGVECVLLPQRSSRGCLGLAC